MYSKTLVLTNAIENASHISFNASLTGITEGRLYEVFFGESIGFPIDDEHYIINDFGERVHGIWVYYKTNYYEINNDNNT